jgi:hypothetical protein
VGFFKSNFLSSQDFLEFGPRLYYG